MSSFSWLLNRYPIQTTKGIRTPSATEEYQTFLKWRVSGVLRLLGVCCAKGMQSRTRGSTDRNVCATPKVLYRTFVILSAAASELNQSCSALTCGSGSAA